MQTVAQGLNTTPRKTKTSCKIVRLWQKMAFCVKAHRDIWKRPAVHCRGSSSGIIAGRRQVCCPVDWRPVPGGVLLAHTCSVCNPDWNQKINGFKRWNPLCATETAAFATRNNAVSSNTMSHQQWSYHYSALVNSLTFRSLLWHMTPPAGIIYRRQCIRDAVDVCIFSTPYFC